VIKQYFQFSTCQIPPDVLRDLQRGDALRRDPEVAYTNLTSIYRTAFGWAMSRPHECEEPEVRFPDLVMLFREHPDIDEARFDEYEDISPMLPAYAADGSVMVFDTAPDPA
jgi:hypothetical protein